MAGRPARTLRTLLSLPAVALFFACDAGAPGAEWPRRSELGGMAPDGLSWVREPSLKECLRAAAADSGLQVVALRPDSAEAVRLSHAFLGPRGAGQVPTRVVRLGSGTVVQLQDTTPGVVDGTNSVYVDTDRCVTYLGW